MPGVKCPNPECGFDGNAPEWEFCGHCGFDLATPAPSQAPPKAQELPLMSPPPDDIGLGTMPPPPPAISLAKAKLVVTGKGRVGHEFPITTENVAIGRWDPEAGSYPEVDLTEDDPDCYVSRHHARIFFKDGRYFIEDLGSANKTIINKSTKLNPHSPHELKSGDEVIVGKTFLNFVII